MVDEKHDEDIVQGVCEATGLHLKERDKKQYPFSPSDNPGVPFEAFQFPEDSLILISEEGRGWDRSWWIVQPFH